MSKPYDATSKELLQSDPVGWAAIQVSAAMSFDRLERKTDVLDPDKQVAAAETKSEVLTGTQGAGGQNTSSTTYDNY